MSQSERICVYCKQKKTVFTKEHIVPVSLGGTTKYLKDLVCAECNTTFNEGFEGKFLKGPGFESLFRGLKDKKVGTGYLYLVMAATEIDFMQKSGNNSRLSRYP
jgi:hypothetical protein